MLLLSYLLPAVAAFHFYADLNEVRCFIEDLPKGTAIVGIYKAKLFDSTSGLYTDQAVQMGIAVHQTVGALKLVDSVGDRVGKFAFTSTAHGDHSICLYATTDPENQQAPHGSTLASKYISICSTAQR